MIDVADVDAVLQPLVVTYRVRGLQLEWSPSGAGRLPVDPDAVCVIVGNLLGNALLHCPEASCRLAVRADDELVITVSDDGPGVIWEDRGRAFDVGARRMASSGEGVGLAVSRDLARRHGGDLVLLDTDQGCAFQLTLPLSAVDPIPIPSPRSALRDEVALRLAG